jgi:chromosome segregation protein
MKIKKLTIQGFKSFTDRTQFLFPDGISAVVGPNGCGKSNIVDAIRWVLGEQNARHLRGKIMEDLIFSGSDSRKPVGMAEVTLTLSNEEGNAPARYANFTEIEIQRRLYRSGESGYLINKVPVRLKDITELFTDTGVGTRAYSIIEQGQVGWLVTAKPEERRTLFEEAAGINKFKTKKEAALRRLESTKINLTRVSDIVSEVKRQLNSLNRQAKKAERYGTFKDELKKLDMFVTHKDYSELMEKKGSHQRRLTGLSDEELSITNRLSSKENLAEEVKIEYLQKEEEFKGLREKAFELERQIQNQERSGEIARLRIEELTRTAERLTFDIEELKSQDGSTGAELQNLQSELTGARELLMREEEKLHEVNGRTEALTTALDEKESQLKSREAASLESRTKLTDLRHAIEGCLKEKDFTLERRAKAMAETEEVSKEIEYKEAPLNDLRQGVEYANERGELQSVELSEAKCRLEGIEGKRAATYEKLKAAKDDLTAKSSRLKTLKEMEQNLEGAKDGVRAIMQRGANNDTHITDDPYANHHITSGASGGAASSSSGIRGLIADVIETSPGYERAVEAVLGERLHYVVVESQREGIEAIEYLKTHSSGRGSFIPMTDPRYHDAGGDDYGMSTPLESTAETTPEGTKRLLSEVNVKDGYSKVLKVLLGDVLVVDNFKDALTIWTRNGITDTLVTPEGEMIDQKGIITGGYSNGSDGGLLQKRREIKELTELTNEAESNYKDLTDAVKETDIAIAEVKAKIEGLSSGLHSEEIARVNKESEFKLFSDEVARLKARHAALAIELNEAREALTGIEEKKASLSLEREAIESSIKEREEAVARSAEDLRELRINKDSLALEATDVKVSLASTKEKFEHLDSLINTKKTLIEDIARRIDSKTREIADGSEEIIEKRTLDATHKEALDVLLIKKDSEKRDEVIVEEALTAMRGRVDATDAEIKELRAALISIQEQGAALSLELKTMELDITNMKDKTIERYGTGIDSYRPDEEVGALDETAVKERVAELREKIGKMGEVSLSALEEFTELEERYNFLIEQQEDLTKSMESVRGAISRINRTTRDKFQRTFDAINEEFKKNFPRFFNGGKAELKLSSGDDNDNGKLDVLECGVEIVAQPPGKKLQNINLLSGGEKALTATALIFSIFLVKPSPFCLLDEVDAPLDDANIDRFNGFVREMSAKSQFILITHNKRTMEMVDTLFGITMQEPGVSKIVSVEL